MNQCESTWMVAVSSLECVKIRMDNMRTTKPSLDAIQISFLSWFMGKKHLESQQINVSQTECILLVHYIAWKLVWATGGPINQLSMQSKCLPLTSKICYEELKCLWSLKTSWITMNQYESTWMDPVSRLDCVKIRMDNTRTTQPSLDAMQMPFQPWFMGKIILNYN